MVSKRSANGTILTAIAEVRVQRRNASSPNGKCRVTDAKSSAVLIASPFCESLLNIFVSGSR